VSAPDVPQGFYVLKVQGEFDRTVSKVFIH
jgi:hypothetical protein